MNTIQEKTWVIVGKRPHTEVHWMFNAASRNEAAQMFASEQENSMTVEQVFAENYVALLSLEDWYKVNAWLPTRHDHQIPACLIGADFKPKTRTEISKAFIAADLAWSKLLPKGVNARYTEAGRGEPGSPLRAAHDARQKAYRAFEKAWETPQ